MVQHLYPDGHGERFPAAGDPIDGKTDGYDFGGGNGTVVQYGDANHRSKDRVLNRYLDIEDENSPNVEIFHCPDDLKDITVPSFPPALPTAFKVFGISYMMNYRLVKYDSGRARPLSTVTSPKEKVFPEACFLGNRPSHVGEGYAVGGPLGLVMVFFWRAMSQGRFPLASISATATSKNLM